MEIPDELVSLFNTRVEWRGGSFVVEIPTSEIRYGAITLDTTYRVAIVSSDADLPRWEGAVAPYRSEAQTAGLRGGEPPVSVGDTLTVRIEDIGEQGDGITRVDGEFVIFVPDTDVGDEVTIEVTHLVDTYGFGRVVDDSDGE